MESCLPLALKWVGVSEGCVFCCFSVILASTCGVLLSREMVRGRLFHSPQFQGETLKFCLQKQKQGVQRTREDNHGKGGMSHFSFPLCILLKNRSGEVLGEGDLLPVSAGSCELQDMTFDNQVPH